jgi:hypothetical protein
VWGPCSKLPLWSDFATILRPSLLQFRVCPPESVIAHSPPEKENWPLRSALFSPFAEVEVPVERERNIPKLLKAGSGRVSPLRVFDLSGLRRCCHGQAGPRYSAPVVPCEVSPQLGGSVRTKHSVRQIKCPYRHSATPVRPFCTRCFGIGLPRLSSRPFQVSIWQSLPVRPACFYDLHIFINVSCHAHA